MRYNDQRVPVAIFIDGENISPVLADDIFLVAERKGRISFAAVYGNTGALTAWDAVIKQQVLDVRGHSGGKNAADELIKIEMWMFRAQTPIRTFILASHDKHFAILAEEICLQLGCSIHGVGTRQASPRLVMACTTYTYIISTAKG